MSEHVYYQLLLRFSDRQRAHAWGYLDMVAKEFELQLTASINGRHYWNEDLHLRMFHEGETDPIPGELRYNCLRLMAKSPAGELWLRLHAPEGAIEEIP